MKTDLATLYDALPYPRLVHSFAHPRVTGAMGLLFGLDVAPVEGARVLDLGCAAGTSVISLAAEFPGATFVGVDLSPAQIALGRELVATLGLTNVELIVSDIDALDLPARSFDYVIAHGVYSWVPEAVQRSLLAACERLLADQGVAYISYNTFPGWQIAGVVRELFMRETPPDVAPIERVRRARALLDEHVAAAEEGSFRRAILLAEREFLEGGSDAYLFHEYLTPDNHAVWVRDFVTDAAAAGLAYIADARAQRVLPLALPPAIAASVRAAQTTVEQQQLIDHHTNARFRRSLLTRAGAALELNIDPARLRRLHVHMERSRRVERTAYGASTTNRADHVLRIEEREVAEILLHLSSTAPQSMPLTELVDVDDPAARGLLGQLVGLYFTEVLELTLAPVRAATRLPERPLVSELGREQARRGDAVTTGTYVSQPLDALALRVVPLLDGTRTLAEVAGELGETEQDVEGLVRILLDRSVIEA